MLATKFWILKGYPVIDYILAYLTDTEIIAHLTPDEVETTVRS